MTIQREPIDRFFSIIPAGGIGSRLWPLSRASAPKFLHDLTGSGQTLLQDTWDRLTPLAGRGFWATHVTDSYMRNLNRVETETSQNICGAGSHLASSSLDAVLDNHRPPMRLLGAKRF